MDSFLSSADLARAARVPGAQAALRGVQPRTNLLLQRENHLDALAMLSERRSVSSACFTPWVSCCFPSLDAPERPRYSARHGFACREGRRQSCGRNDQCYVPGAPVLRPPHGKECLLVGPRGPVGL